ncbi:hypothetical protein KCP78_08735 [Salmonella enterica subsp. enterica]|nr:hypothetical protein KCP78_08735 [Salmonella enterica subsp. enterica]
MGHSYPACCLVIIGAGMRAFIVGNNGIGRGNRCYFVVRNTRKYVHGFSALLYLLMASPAGDVLRERDGEIRKRVKSSPVIRVILACGNRDFVSIICA